MGLPSTADVEEVVELFGVDTKSVKPLDDDQALVVYSVRDGGWAQGARVFVLDAPEARALACFPHIVGRAFKRLNLSLATKAASVVAELSGLDGFGGSVVHLHVLRAGPGYELHGALERVLGGLREAYTRPLYAPDRSSLSIGYENFKNLPRNCEVAVVAPDTVATGRTMVAALERLVSALRQRGCEARTLVLYGFLSKPGIGRIAREASRLGIKEVYAFALVDVAALASNEYDMVLYGPDLSSEDFKPLGSITSFSTLESCAPYYVPGLDQPGDWSSRQFLLFNGRGLEIGDMVGHLKGVRERVEEVLRRFDGQEWFRAWHREACKRTLRAVNAVYERVARVLREFRP